MEAAASNPMGVADSVEAAASSPLDVARSEEQRIVLSGTTTEDEVLEFILSQAARNDKKSSLYAGLCILIIGCFTFLNIYKYIYVFISFDLSVYV